ncbi:MAG: hypothetical protein PVF25_19640, partial [Desulfobacterales bacterium]
PTIVQPLNSRAVISTEQTNGIKREVKLFFPKALFDEFDSIMNTSLRSIWNLLRALSRLLK